MTIPNYARYTLAFLSGFCCIYLINKCIGLSTDFFPILKTAILGFAGGYMSVWLYGRIRKRK
jgi:hypothetical protein